MATAYPSLSSEGFVRTPDRKADRILAAVMSSDHSQSNIYLGNVSSIQWTISQYRQDDLRLAEEMQLVLETVFGKYFDLAKFDVVVQPIADDPSRLDIRVKGVVVQDGAKYSFARLLDIKDSVISSMKEITYK